MTDLLILIAIASFLAWAAISFIYLRLLRGILNAREVVVRAGMKDLTAQAKAWQEALQQLGLREFREAASGLDRVLDIFTKEDSLSEMMRATREVALVMAEQKTMVSRLSGISTRNFAERAARLETTLKKLEADIVGYKIAARDGKIANERFPLSLLALAAGLRVASIRS